MQLRADLGARRGLDDEIGAGNEKPVDYVAGIGVQYSWGGSSRRSVDSDGDGVTDELGPVPGHSGRKGRGLERLPAAAGR